MPSRKKAKGKARKAAKEAKAKEEESRAVIAANQRQEGSLEAQMQLLTIDNVTSQQCMHGCPSLSTDEEKICMDFIDAFIAVFHSEDKLLEAFFKAQEATAETYADVYVSKLETVISMLLSRGTQLILDEENREAKLCAALAYYFEEWIACEVRKITLDINWTKVCELYGADDHTLVSYYRKRIPCICLDKKYKEVKSVKKMGWCHNPNCSHPGGMVERSKMFSCARCGEVNYCSAACQKANWKRHKKLCDIAVEVKAALNSSQKEEGCI